MDLDKIAARLRPRTPYEATDLGFVLARHFWKPLLLGWLACVLPIVVGAAVIAALTPLFWLPLLVIWWLKPMYDRVPLFVLSRAFFGEVPTTRQTVGYVMGTWRSGRVLADITWRRFNPYRGPAMPVRELERLGGAEASERLKTLLRRGLQVPSGWLVLVCMAVEWLLVGAAIALMFMVTPDALGLDLGSKFHHLFTSGNMPGFELVMLGVYVLAMSAVELAYVAASFGLYINRRVLLEGWDIEIVFKRLASRLRERASAALRGAAIVALVGLTTLAATTRPAAAQQPAAQTAGQSASPVASASPAPGPKTRKVEPSKPALDPQQDIAHILKAPEFGHTKKVEHWTLREDLFGKKKKKKADMSWLENVIASVAPVLQYIMWAIAALLLIAVLYYIIRKVRIPEGGAESEVEVAARTDYDTPEETPRVTLPADIVDAAIAAWRQGDRPQSLSLLYRGTIRGLASGYRIEIDDSMTARECAGKVREAGGPADYVAELARAWTATVYADRPVSDERAQQLFGDWKRHFRPDTGPSAPGGVR